jgi:iron(III) transport system substrate-binding protein
VRAALAVVAAACLVTLAGCGQAGEGHRGSERPAPVVVYLASEDDEYLTELIKDYEFEADVDLVVRRGAADTIVQGLITKRIDPPADVLVTRSVADIQRAATHGALRPLAAEGVEPPVPGWLRDPDGFWVGLGFRIAVMAYDPAAVEPGAGVSYPALANSDFKDRLCLSSSRNPVNRALIAQLIAAQDARTAEITVRAWIVNLARPVFESDAEVLDAIAARNCAIGIVSSAALARPDAGLSVAVPVPAFADADAVGIGRHARNPDGAAALVSWLLAPEAQQRLAAQTRDYPASPAAQVPAGLPVCGGQNASLATWHIEDAEQLAERAHYP